jgi:hypothetical protein
MSRLDDMITRARQLPVDEAGAQRYVAELGRWAHREQPAPSRGPWFVLGFGFAAAAAAIAVVVLLPPRTAREISAVRIGERVAIVAEPNTQYRVLASEGERTELFVERGTITARLWPGARPHHLALRADGVEAVATGTVYSLAVDEAGASVHVHEGKVAVARGSERVSVEAGTSWPANARKSDRRAADTLLALATLDVVATAPVIDATPAPEPVDDAQTIDAPPARAPSASPVADARPVLSLKERWRQARLLRGQGNFETAIAECLAIAGANDTTWSPIALLEAARIELGPRASPERAIALADRFEREWPSHELAPEARELRCRALRQLGRARECKPRQ